MDAFLFTYFRVNTTVINDGNINTGRTHGREGLDRLGPLLNGPGVQIPPLFLF